MRPRRSTESPLRLLVRAIIFAAAMVSGPSLAEEARHFDPATGYRIDRYRAPTPDTAPGATTVTEEDVKRLMRDERAILVDAMAAEGAGPDPDTGAWRLTRKREHIPGSVWLPDVGRGVLSPQMERYFKSNLQRLTNGNRHRAIIFYCLADCWMGWNAAKRAAEYGFQRVYWYPEGTDGWRDWEGTLVPAIPTPVTRQD